MTICVHQPNFFPWLGFYHKIWSSDVYVAFDDVQFIRQSFTRRVRVRQAFNTDDISMLIVPLLHHPQITPINTLRIDHTQNWSLKAQNQLFNAYRRAPFFEPYFPTIQGILNEGKQFDKLSEMNIFAIRAMLKVLQMEQKKIIRSSDLALKHLKADEYIAAIVHKLGGTHYLSGVGAQKYQRDDIYHKYRVQLVYSNFSQYIVQNPYSQAQGSQFVGGLSVLDALFNVGTAGITRMFESVETQSRLVTSAV